MLKNHGTEIKSSLEAIVLNQIFANIVKSDKNKYYSHKRLLSLRPHIVKLICEISKIKIK